MPEEKSRYTLPSTSFSVQPVPLSKTTGNSFTWPDRPFMIFVARACSSFDFGPGISALARCGTFFRSTFAQPMSMLMSASSIADEPPKRFEIPRGRCPGS